ncbi:MAG TPA: hypothetical protein VD772_06255 [Anseongella sp.]|nr:hypothetical protein [Anseongella sp.]
MKQMNIPEDARLPVDYEDEALSRAVRELRPVIYRDGQLLRCLLGPDLKEGISGSGRSQQEAIADWIKNLRERVARGNVDDEVAQYARDTLNTSVDDVW